MLADAQFQYPADVVAALLTGGHMGAVLRDSDPVPVPGVEPTVLAHAISRRMRQMWPDPSETRDKTHIKGSNTISATPSETKKRTVLRAKSNIVLTVLQERT